MQIKLISQGLGKGTAVINAETGQRIQDVVEVYFHHVAGEEPKLAIDVLAPRIELQAEAEVRHVCPYCGAQKEVGEKES